MATTKKSSTTKAAKAGAFSNAPGAAPAGSFQEIPPELIVMESQIRSRIDQEGEAFKGLVESIREKGVLEPILVTPVEENYRLISGERRLLAARVLGLATVPARVIDGVSARDEVLALQLTENLQRADLDPIDTALALVAYIQAKSGGSPVPVEEIISALITLERDPERLPQEVADIVSAIQKITGKSLRSLERGFSLLTLPGEIQQALREGSLGVSQGYLLAAHLDHPRLTELFGKAAAGDITTAQLEKELKKGQSPSPADTTQKDAVARFRRSVGSVKSGIEARTDAFKKSDLEALLADLRELIALVEGRLPEAVDDAAPTMKAPALRAKAPAKRKGRGPVLPAIDKRPGKR
jgi:ParB family chromosome partitioning protein